MAPARRQGLFHPAIAFCFLLSGVTSLTFEILWVRMLTTSVFGASHIAVATVVSVFMGGMALGSWLGGKLADRIERPVLAYAMAEGAIGIYGLLFPAMLGAAPVLHRAVWSMFAASFYTFSLARFFIASLILLVPTTLMGATLPLLSRQVTSRAVEAGRKVGYLYSLNTLGAAAGVLLGGFFLMPVFGIKASNYFTVTMDLTICAVMSVMALKGLLDKKKEDPDADLQELLYPQREAMYQNDAHLPSWLRSMVVMSFALGGFSAMVYQVVWTRTLVLSFGSSVYSFSLILLAFILGLGTGSLYFTSRRVDRLKRPVTYLAVIFLGIGISAFAGSLYLDSLPFAVLELVRGGRVHVSNLLFSEFGLTCLVIFIPTFCMGAVFPVVIRLSALDDRQIGSSVGRVYSANTLGSILGAFSAAFLMLPFLGGKWTIAVALIIDLILAIILAAGDAVAQAFSEAGTSGKNLAKSMQGRWPHFLGAVACIIAVVAAPSWDPAKLSAGLFRVYLAHEVYGHRNWSPPKKILYFKHSTSCTVTVEKLEGGFLALKVNGKTDASSTGDMPTQILVSAIPLLLHPKPVDVAVVGYGSGATVGAALQFPVKSVLAIELEKAVVQAAEFFASYTWHPRSDPRLRIMYDDGRNVFSSISRRFDVIVSEPSNPWITGVSNLFTVDYFTIAKQRLKPGGLFCQWLQMYELSPKNVKIVARTFASCFKYVLLFVSEPESTDAIMIGSDSPIRLNLASMQRAFENKKIKKMFERAKVKNRQDILSLFLLGDREIPALLGPGPKNTDDNMLIEFSAPRDMLQYGRYREFALEIYYRDSLEKDLLSYVDGIPANKPERAKELSRISMSLLKHGRFVAAGQVAGEALKYDYVEEAGRADLMSMLFLKEDRFAPAVDWPEPGSIEYDRLALLKEYVESEKFEEALEEIEGLKKDGDTSPELEYLHGFLEYATDDFDGAIESLEKLIEHEPGLVARRPGVLYYLARAYGWRAKNQKAVSWMERFIDESGFKTLNNSMKGQ
ncbi:MAG: hypothetical protein GXP49_17325 [Deltaproteobacteria bacterium]|nr:hypothetical protein [Deltaproteobacteria bacterium]